MILKWNVFLKKNPIRQTNSVSLIRKLSSRKFFDDSDELTRKTKQELTEIENKETDSEYKQTIKGWVYAKNPMKYHCLEGKAYVWCSCGRSHKQPFCDGTHRDPYLKITLKPLRWDCKESKDYWFCMCKHTRHPPFCDGTHRSDDIQQSNSTIRDAHSPPQVIEKIKKKK